MKRICFLLPSHWSANKGGAELQVKYLIDYLLEKTSYEIHYICRYCNEINSSRLKFHKVKNISYFGKNLFVLDYFNIIRYLKEINPYIIYQRNAGDYTGIAAKYAKKIVLK